MILIVCQTVSKCISLRALMLVLLMSATLAPALASAGPVTCKAVLTHWKRFPMTQTEGKRLITTAFAEHPTIEGISAKLLERMIMNTTESIDPMGMLLLQSEVRGLQVEMASDPQHAAARFVLANVQGPNPINKARKRASDSVMALYEFMVKEPGLRQKVIALAQKESKDDALPRKEKKTPDYPLTEQEKNERLVQALAKSVRALTGMGQSANDAYVVSVRNMLRFLNRQFDMLSDDAYPTLVLSSVLSSLDPHSNYLAPEDARSLGALSDTSRRSMIGVAFNEVASGFQVQKIVSGMPAEQAGIKVGDVITHMNGEFVRGSDAEALREMMGVGKPGTDLIVRLRRDGKTLEATIKHAEAVNAMSAFGIQDKIFPTPSGDIGSIHLSSFYRGATTDLEIRVNRMVNEQNVKGLIIDLRGNGGGLLEEAHGILDLFIAQGSLFRFKQGKDNGEHRVANMTGRKKHLEIPIVALVDDGSASASELVSIVLQDYGRAIVVGTKQTFGKGSVQTTFPARTDDANAGMVKLTTGLYYSVSGRSPQLNGVESDIVIIDKGSRLELERDRTGVLDAGKIDSNLEVPYPLMPNRDAVLKKLRARSEKRVGSEKSSTSTDAALNEAARILSDLIEATR